jgi:cytochrome c553
MRTAAVIFAGFLVVAFMAHAADDCRSRAAGGAPALSPVPESLDAFYPPAADRPVYLLMMLDLETSFSGIVVDLMEDDLEGARGSFEDFQRQYRDVAGMVPEWKGVYRDGPVKELGAALAAGDRSRAMDAFAAVGGTCHRCHMAAMVPVQQKYHWGDFGAVTVQDPLSGVDTGYPQFKRLLSANLAGITVNLRQGQIDNARRQFEGFRARFAALSGSCRECHEKPSRYFVDREMEDTVEELGKAFRSRTVAADAVTALVQKIGRESCSKCHLVHLPAAHAGGAGR